MTFQTEYAITARKPHICEICQGRIAKGTRHLKLVGKFDGEFYAERAHADRYALWNGVYLDWGEPYEGMIFNLAEVFVDGGYEDAVRDTLNTLRGHHPHAVCRIEFRLRNWLEGGEA